MTLIAAYNFEQSDDPTAADVSGNGHDLIWGENGTLIAGYHGDYAVLSGAGNQLEWGAGAYGPYAGGSPLGAPLSVLFWAKVANVADTTYISVANEPGATDRDDPMGIWVTSEGAVLAWWYSDANQDGPAPLAS